jgi:hypothetical protein
MTLYGNSSMTALGKPIHQVASLSADPGMDMDRTVTVRLLPAVAVLGAMYYCLLAFLIGLTAAIPWPSWWIGVFHDRHIGGLAWIIGSHTIGVFSAATPIAVVSVLINRGLAGLLGLAVGFKCKRQVRLKYSHFS